MTTHPTQAPGRSPARDWNPWLIAERILLVVWVAAALVHMYPGLGRRIHLRGGFFTSYAADLANPAWVYILCRRRPGNRLSRWFGRSPELAAGSIFLVGVVSECAQLRWTTGPFGGTFDPLDILAFGAGLFVCFVADKWELRKGAREKALPAS